MLKPGDMVRVKNKETGEKVHAVITDVRMEVAPIFDGIDQMVPGRRSMTITLEVTP